MVNESETLKKDFNVKNKNSYDEFDKKLRENEDEIQKLKEQNQILQKEISDLKKNSLDEKMDLEMQYKSREARLLDDEQNKNLMEKEGLLKRIKVLENTKEDLEGKLNDKKGSNQNLKSNPRDNEYVKYENQISELRSQNAQLLKNNGDLESEKSSMLIDLKAKENLINQYKNKASEIDKLRDNLEREKNSYLIKKEKEFKKEKESFEIEKGKLNDKIRELENEVDVLRGRLDKFEEKREMIKEQMKRTLLNYVENNKI